MKLLENQFCKVLRGARSFCFFSGLLSEPAGGPVFRFGLWAKCGGGWEKEGIPFSPAGVGTEQPTAQPELRCCHHRGHQQPRRGVALPSSGPAK